MHFKEIYHLYSPFNPTQFSQFKNEILYRILYIFYEMRKIYPLVSSWKGLAGDLQHGGVVGVSILGLSNASQHVSGPLECARDGLYVWVWCV